jgi:hypothetical chaperone protein
MGASVDRVLAASGVRCDEIDCVFLTGGSAFVPAVRSLFAERFGAEKIAGGAESHPLRPVSRCEPRARLTLSH